MTLDHSPIEYGDNLSMPAYLIALVDQAVVMFVNSYNRESDVMEGLDDPLFHLPKPTESVSKMHALRRWHGVP